MVDGSTLVTTPDVIAYLESESVWRTSGRGALFFHLVGAGGSLLRRAAMWKDVDVPLVDDVTPYEVDEAVRRTPADEALCDLADLAGDRLSTTRRRSAVRRVLREPWNLKRRRRRQAGPGPILPNYKRMLIEWFAESGVRETIRLCAAPGLYPEVCV